MAALIAGDSSRWEAQELDSMFSVGELKVVDYA